MTMGYGLRKPTRPGNMFVIVGPGVCVRNAVREIPRGRVHAQPHNLAVRRGSSPADSNPKSRGETNAAGSVEVPFEPSAGCAVDTTAVSDRCIKPLKFQELAIMLLVCGCVTIITNKPSLQLYTSSTHLERNPKPAPMFLP